MMVIWSRFLGRNWFKPARIIQWSRIDNEYQLEHIIKSILQAGNQRMLDQMSYTDIKLEVPTNMHAHQTKLYTKRCLLAVCDKMLAARLIPADWIGKRIFARHQIIVLARIEFVTQASCLNAVEGPHTLTALSILFIPSISYR